MCDKRCAVHSDSKVLWKFPSDDYFVQRLSHQLYEFLKVIERQKGWCSLACVSIL